MISFTEKKKLDLSPVLYHSFTIATENQARNQFIENVKNYTNFAAINLEK